MNKNNIIPIFDIEWKKQKKFFKKSISTNTERINYYNVIKIIILNNFIYKNNKDINISIESISKIIFYVNKNIFY